jgi:methionyl aminopeptidase
VLQESDIINVDVTPIVEGFHGDSSRTFFVGDKIPDNARKLTECASKCLDLGIAEVRDGCRVGDIGHAIQEYAEGLGYGVVRDFVGHGIGRKFHEDPQITHYGNPGKGLRLTKGMVFTIEPMINEGDWRCEILEDGWTAVTVDGKLSAQFEHTIAIRNDGTVEILTKP